MPQARKGREQRQSDRANKDFQKAFGDIAAGYMGVPGLPNYLQVFSPNVVTTTSSRCSRCFWATY
jgi:hypothetical protein